MTEKDKEYQKKYDDLKKTLEKESGEKIDLILGCDETDADWRQELRKKTKGMKQ